MNTDSTSTQTPNDAITVDPTRLAEILGEIEAEEQGQMLEAEDVNSFLQDLVASDGPLGLPDGAEVVAYFLDGDGPGFIFGLRPRRIPDRDGGLSSVNVTGWFTEVRDLVDYETEGREQYETLASNVEIELTVLLPAYRKLFGASGQAAAGAVTERPFPMPGDKTPDGRTVIASCPYIEEGDSENERTIDLLMLLNPQDPFFTVVHAYRDTGEIDRAVRTHNVVTATETYVEWGGGI